MSDALLARESERRQRALDLAERLNLFEEWSSVGKAHLVGAVAYGLVVSPDIDVEVFTPGEPTITEGFAVLARLADNPWVVAARCPTWPRSTFTAVIEGGSRSCEDVIAFLGVDYTPTLTMWLPQGAGHRPWR